MSNDVHETIEDIIDDHQSYLEDWIYDHAWDYESYLHGGYTSVPYGSTMVSLPQDCEIRDDKYEESLLQAAEDAIADGRIVLVNGKYIIN